jgi:hypothetical protein
MQVPNSTLVMLRYPGTHFTCFTGTKVQKGEIRRAVVPEAKKLSVGYSVYLLYWYKSANTDA